jgi:hypothetical protein
MEHLDKEDILDLYEAVMRIASSLEKLVGMVEEERNGDDPREES